VTHPYLDSDSTDDFVDLPLIRYSDGTDLLSMTTPEMQKQLLDPEWRREHGLGPAPAYPPPVDH
jgi:hypothetical protein